jgi:uncharacterized protein (DUF2252 family)
MRKGVFAFLRATFYRWSQIFPEFCSDLRLAPTVLAVADLHVENFGTWRDGDDRLVWGINDFDESMGWEAANVHLGSPNSIKNIRRNLAKRKASWLRDGAKAMVKATTRDWKEWKNS